MWKNGAIRTYHRAQLRDCANPGDAGLCFPAPPAGAYNGVAGQDAASQDFIF